MEFLGVGVPELAFIVLIALILLGPKDMVAAGRTIGKFLRKVLTSPEWMALRKTGEELQQLPTKLVREAGLEELQALQKEVQGAANQIKPFEMPKIFDEGKLFDPSTELVITDDKATRPKAIEPEASGSEPPSEPGPTEAPSNNSDTPEP